MLLEDYTTAIFWRIASIFFTVSSIFSVGVIIWYLIYRENPNMPDETDSDEKLRFNSDFNKEKHNLLTEIIGSFKNFPSIGIKSDPTKVNNNFIHRLCYLLFGSMNQDEKINNVKIESEEKIITNETSIFQFFKKD